MRAEKTGSPARRVAIVGAFAAVAMIFSYVEALIPFNFGIPGVKLGLANLAIVIALYMLTLGEAFLVDVVRIVLTGLLFGNGLSIMYSLAGGVLSFAVMAIAVKSGRLSAAGVSIIGGVSHNVGQLAVAIAVTATLKLSYYLPVLLVSGLVTGTLIGLAAGRILKLLEKVAQHSR